MSSDRCKVVVVQRYPYLLTYSHSEEACTHSTIYSVKAEIEVSERCHFFQVSYLNEPARASPALSSTDGSRSDIDSFNQ